jgi:predicted nuclease of predicted toxin-antitoxin system
MKVLLDTSIWCGAAPDLSSAGHDVRWMGDSEPDPRDATIMQLAFDEDRVLITLDQGFGELAVVYGRPHRGIIRLVDLPGRQQGGQKTTLVQPTDIMGLSSRTVRKKPNEVARCPILP